MTSLECTMRRLERLHEACGGSNNITSCVPISVGNGEEEVDTSHMTAYEKGQYRIACSMKRVRHNVSDMETKGNAMNITQQAELSNSIRRDISSMKREAAALHRVAVRERRREDYSQLMSHVNKTEQLQRARFSSHIDDAIDVGGGGFSVSGATAFTNRDTPQGSSVPLLSARDDEEFALFFEQTKKQDLEIDESLDRIGAGLLRLNENALLLNSELETQEVMLGETELKVDEVHGKLASMNSRLRKALKDMDKSKVTVYVFCCIILLGIIGGIYSVSS